MTGVVQTEVARTARARVLVAAHRVVERGGIRVALGGSEFSICGEAGGLEAAVGIARETKPDLCLIDVDLPGGGIAAAERIAIDVPAAAVVMLANTVREQDVFDSLRAGAMGFLPAAMDPGRLPHALRGILKGEAALPRLYVGRLIDELRERNRRRVFVAKREAVELTSREWQVLELMQQRLSTKEIALRLGIAQVTVRRHVSSILRKLEVGSRAAALELLSESTG